MSIWQELQDEINLDHGAHSQKATVLGMALAGIRESFSTLVKHGYNLHLERGPAPPAALVEWPKMYVKRWKDDDGVEHIEHLSVASDVMAKNLTSGWVPNEAEPLEEGQKRQQAEAEAKAQQAKGGGPMLGVGPNGKPTMTTRPVAMPLKWMGQQDNVSTRLGVL